MSTPEPPPYPGGDDAQQPGLNPPGFPPPPPAPPAGPQYGSAPTYGAPAPQYGYSAPQYSATPPTNGLAIASLILGIVGVLGLCCYGVPGLLLGIGAIVCGHLSKKAIEASNGTQGGAGMAKAGFILGIVSVVLGVIAVALVIVFFGIASMGTFPTDY